MWCSPHLARHQRRRFHPGDPHLPQSASNRSLAGHQAYFEFASKFASTAVHDRHCQGRSSKSTSTLLMMIWHAMGCTNGHQKQTAAPTIIDFNKSGSRNKDVTDSRWTYTCFLSWFQCSLSCDSFRYTSHHFGRSSSLIDRHFLSLRSGMGSLSTSSSL